MTNAPGGLGALPQFDERSRGYNVAALFSVAEQPRSMHWDCKVMMDQGQEGACVGFGWAAELAAVPVVVAESTPDAFALYHEAQLLDGWALPHEGSSILAGAKAVQARGHLDEYRWAFNFPDLELAISNHGPAVLGIPWYTNMDWPDPATGLINVGGTVRGRHCILANGISPRLRLVHLHNSWGDQHEYAIGYADLIALLNEGGEACIPVVRR